jgi:hypothetical protein
MDHQDVIATLNDLREISGDGEQGLRTCAESVDSPNLEALFEVAGRRCAEGEGSHHEHPHNYRFDMVDRLVRFFVEPEFEGCEPLIQATQP